MAGDRRGPARDWKMVLVLRGELRLTPGKAAVQIAHAAVMLIKEADRRHSEWVEAWTRSGQKKIALLAESLDELETLRRRATARGLPAVLVEDAGFTEVPPGTKTCLGIGPGPAAEVDSVTGELPLY
jgi:peptidyl-tRNA hydrolase, PTH2 family